MYAYSTQINAELPKKSCRDFRLNMKVISFAKMTDDKSMRDNIEHFPTDIVNFVTKGKEISY